MKKIMSLLFTSLLFSCVSTKGTDGRPEENGEHDKNNTKGEDGKNGENGKNNSNTIFIKL